MDSLHIKKYQVKGPSLAELQSLKDEIFNQEVYAFESPHPRPTIVDIGAHVGIASLYWLWHYPLAQIWAVEAHPQLVQLYQENLLEQGLRPTAIIHAALAVHANAEMVLHTDPEWPSSSSLLASGWTGAQQLPESIRVPGLTMSALFDRLPASIDLLKLDIEGQEPALLKSIPPKDWQRIHQVLVEFHPGQGQSLPELSAFLETKGFALEYRKSGKSVSKHQAKGLVVVAGVKK